MTIGSIWNTLSSRTQDILVAGCVALGVFALLQVVVMSQAWTWWYRDTPFPTGRPVQEARAATGELNESLRAELTIPSANITVPLVWSTSAKEADFQKDLEHGAIHYPGTPLPGQTGNAFIAAHSSDAYWKPGDYKHAFASLGKLTIGNEDIVVTYYKNEEVVKKVSFRVTEKAVVSADDQRMFTQTNKTEMTLVTCWPLGTNWRRLMVKTEMIQ